MTSATDCPSSKLLGKNVKEVLFLRNVMFRGFNMERLALEICVESHKL